MRQNKHVQPSRHAGTPKKGSNSDHANLPANNHGTMPVKLGAGKPTSIIKSSNGKNSGKAGVVDSTGAHINSTNYINTGNKARMGNTMHGVGQVPAYLRNPKNPDTKNISN